MLPVTAVSKDEVDNCPIRQVLSKVTGKWQMILFLALEDGALRFGELKRTVGDITQRVLTENLRSLERDGYVTRTVEAGPPISVHYALTPLGAELVPHLKTLVIWAAGHHDQVNTSRTDYDARVS